MSARIKLEIHQVEIRKRGKPDEDPINLGDIDGNGLKFNDIFFEFIKWLDIAQYANDGTKKYLLLND